MRLMAALAFVCAGALAWWLSASAPRSSSSSLALVHEPESGTPLHRDAELEVAAACVPIPATEPVALETVGITGDTSASAQREVEASLASVVHGTLLDDLGQPIEGVWATTIDAHGVRRNQQPRADGTFAFADLPPGKTRLQGGKLGWIDGVTELDLGEGEVQRHDLTVTRAPIVRLRCGDGAGRRLRDMLAEASFSVSPKFAFAATVAEPGANLDPPHPGGNETYDAGSWWSYPMLQAPVDEHPEAADMLVLRRAPPVWVSLVVNQQVLCKQLVRSTEEPVHLELTLDDLLRLRAALRLVVLDDESGAPVRARVTIGFGSPRDTTEEGGLVLERLPAGPLDLVIDATGFVTSHTRTALFPGESHGFGEIRLRRPARIAGRVVDADGAPLLVEVAVEPLEGDVGPHTRAFTQTGAEGQFELSAFPPGRYTVRVRGDDEAKRPNAPDTIWTSCAVTVDTRLGPRDDVVVVAEPPVPFRVEVPADAAPLQLRLVDVEGRVLRRWAMVPEQFWSLEPRSLKLPRGRFELLASRDGTEVGRWPIDVGARPGALRVELP
jgi:hypothetical protein